MPSYVGSPYAHHMLQLGYADIIYKQVGSKSNICVCKYPNDKTHNRSAIHALRANIGLFQKLAVLFDMIICFDAMNGCTR